MDGLPGSGLAARLKLATRALHTQAERSGVMAELMRGRISLEAYCLLLRQLQPIYAALEAGLDAHAQHPLILHLWRPELRRLPALEQDLDQLHPDAWRSDSLLLERSAAYASRLRTLAESLPWMLLPHAYLRYLGDLHGGQMLARIVRQRFGLPEGFGTAFYAFGDAPQVDNLITDFRRGLDRLELSPQQADAFVEEACEAFRLHQQLFDQLFDQVNGLATAPLDAGRHLSGAPFG